MIVKNKFPEPKTNNVNLYQKNNKSKNYMDSLRKLHNENEKFIKLKLNDGITSRILIINPVSISRILILDNVIYINYINTDKYNVIFKDNDPILFKQFTNKYF